MDRIFDLGKRVDAQDLAEQVQSVMKDLENDQSEGISQTG